MHRMRDFIARVKFREDNLSAGLKFRKAALDKAFADYSLAVGEGKPGPLFHRMYELYQEFKRKVMRAGKREALSA